MRISLMRTPRQVPPIVATAIAALALACADQATAPTPGPRGAVSLVSPSSGALITQNDATIGCPSHATRGHGFRLSFDWEDVVGADRYFVRLKRTGSLYPAIDHSVRESSLDQAWCNAFVIDANLNNWVWRVAAVAFGADSTAADTLWSEERTYGFLPCRHPGGAACSAPPDSLPP